MCNLGRPFNYSDTFPTMYEITTIYTNLKCRKSIKQNIAMQFSFTTIIYVAMYKP